MKPATTPVTVAAPFGELLTIEEAAARIGMSPRYIRRLIAERRIVFYRLGRAVRLDPADLAAHVAAGRVEPMSGTGVGATIGRAA
ncbi:excisionase family DNA binding protein [Kineococcus xinjiangensis]|uniref:Excisionase family DNA binding protein n=1 Tax=Kineococcus xinjiangensis TaxID=512762 RepID=A0A2S6IUZ3_9ACTN|nr:helix-turn-helix domain-containing protein [Kineococcus xinjiangensis]PPK98028.1 excisionase family DNA binding protein [Kineococcus xinjiangensis]